MEFVKCRFAFFMSVMSFLCSWTAAYGASRIWEQVQDLEDDIYFVRKDIKALYDKTNQLNMSAIEGCSPCVSGNKRSRPPLMHHDGRQDMVKATSNDITVKYHSLIKAFVAEKIVNRELQDQLADLRNNMTLMNTESQRVANEKDKEIQDQLRTMRESLEDTITDIYRDIRNNMTTFMNTITHTIDKHLLKTESRSPIPDISTVPIINTNCTTVPENGVYTIYLELIMSPVTVYCDQDTDSGGWIVFMRREDGSVNFTRSWLEYKLGFGSPDGEFWAGNEFLSKLTKKKPLQLRIDMEDFDGNTTFAMYEEFQIGTEEDKYRLHVRGYSGTAGDSLIDTGSLSSHVGMQFSTFDSDNDKSRVYCAEILKGGWWYNMCGAARLNALYSHDKNVKSGHGIIWYSWKGWRESLKRVEMKIR